MSAGHGYTCAVCGGHFHSDRPDADALMEYQEVFSEEQRAFDDKPPAVVCDDCYQRMIREMPPKDFILP